MKAAVYIRVSTEDQAQRGYSLNEQRDSCEARALELGAQEVYFFADEGVSGGKLDRPGLCQLREFLCQEQVSFLVVRDPDRLSRRLAHQLLLTDELERFGVELHFLDFDWQDTPDGRLFYAIRGAIAEYEKEKIRERMMRGRLQKARQGGIPIGFNAYGYIYQSESGRVLPHPEESRVVSEIFEWFVQSDLGCNGIARRLNERGETSRRGSTWHRQVVRQIIANPTYKGCWGYKGVLINVPVLVEEEVWDKAQKKLAAARRLWAGKSNTDYLLSGIVICGVCGCTLNGAMVNWWGKRERRYTCYKNLPDIKKYGCRPREMIPASLLEKAVWEQVKLWLNSDLKLAKEIECALPDDGKKARELTNAKYKIKELDKRQEAVIDSLAGGLLEFNQHVRDKLLLLKRQRIQWEQRVEELTQLIINNEQKRMKPDVFLTAKSFLMGLDEIEFKDKRAIIRSIVKMVEIKRVNDFDADIELLIYTWMPDAEDMIEGN